MKRLGVIFGGRSVEHDVSIVTGLQLLENVDKSKYEAFPIYIHGDGNWYIGEKLKDVAFYKKFDPEEKSISRVFLSPVPNSGGLIVEGKGLFAKTQRIPFDVAVLAMHGMHGEDGTLQGLMELANIPYTSAGVGGSAVGMDKILMKQVFKGMGLPAVDSFHFHRSEWEQNKEQILTQAGTLGFPLFIKPANLGSSVGISKAKNKEGLEAAINIAAGFDCRILVEKGIEAPVELNCACIGYGNDVMPSLVEQPLSSADFLDFEQKYLRGKVSKGMKSLDRRIPAPIDDELTERVKSMTVQIFKTFDCKGVVRIDYMYDRENKKLYVNEINTIPGSFAFYLYEPMGIKFPQLIDKLVEYALAAHSEKNKSVYAHESDILNKVKAAGVKTAPLNK